MRKGALAVVSGALIMQVIARILPRDAAVAAAALVTARSSRVLANTEWHVGLHNIAVMNAVRTDVEAGV